MEQQDQNGCMEATLAFHKRMSDPDTLRMSSLNYCRLYRHVTERGDVLESRVRVN